MRTDHRRPCARAAALSAVAAFVFVGFAGSPAAGQEPPPAPPETTPATTPTTTPTTGPAENPANVPTTTMPEETGEVDGVEVAVGLPPIPPLAPPTEVGEVDGVEVAVAPPPVPSASVSTNPTSAVAPARVSSAPQRLDAVIAAQQLIESMQTIDVLLDAWS